MLSKRYGNYLNERWYAHLIFNLSEAVLIQEGRSLKPGELIKKCKVGNSYHIIFQTKTEILKNKKRKIQST